MLRPLKNFFDPQDYPDLLAGLAAPDDAAIWRLDDQRALVVTTDFFTPVLDDPFEYGFIAAVNSLSDIYAMGGEPFLALNISAFPPNLPTEIASEILRGGAEACKQAGVVIAGGHTIQDKEPKYGLVALGFVPASGILSKTALKPGDQLMLSKPLGIGVITTAIKKDLITEEDAAIPIQWMKRLNKEAAGLAIGFGARAATDITGFSLLGHAWEMAEASGVGLKFNFADMPLHSATMGLAAKWCFPGGAFDNAEFFKPHVRFAEAISQEQQMILFDAQTSGGLLFGIPADRSDACLAKAERRGVPLWKVGEVSDTGVIEVV